MTDDQLSLLGDPADDMLRTADISEDGRYRYSLNRGWGHGSGFLPWIMLNPSTADHEVDDPTIRRCMGFARRLGYAGITVANLYAYRATNPAELWTADDPVGPRNDLVLRAMLDAASVTRSPVVAGWGTNARPDRVAQILAMPGAEQLHSFGVTKDGHPRHPLYLPADAELSPWPKPPVKPFEERDHYVPRPDVPGHVFARVGELVGSSFGYRITCSCGAELGWVVSSGATGTENRHRIEVSS